MEWKPSTYGNYDAWEGTSEKLRVVLVPALGSRIVSLMHRASGREWLDPGGGPVNPGYGVPFPQGGLGGWDEMFPSIDPCRYPDDPWRGTEIPDHGELWSVPWRAELRNGALQCRAYGIRFPYRLTKWLAFEADGALYIRYRAENLSPFPFRFGWTAHPLFRAIAGMRIVLPVREGARFVVTAADGTMADAALPGRAHRWPIVELENGRLRMDAVSGRDRNTYAKIWFCEPLTEGWARLEDPETGQELTLEFPLAKVPYFALWLNYGGYLDGCHVAPEPSTGFGDSLADAIRDGRVATLSPHGSREWHLRVRIDETRRSAAAGNTGGRRWRSGCLLYDGSPLNTEGATDKT